MLSICGFVCGIDTWVDLEEFAEIREDWFRTFLELPNGIPSHDTFGRFFAALNLLKADTSKKSSISTKRKKAGWSADYLCHVLGLPSTYKPRLPRKGPRAAPRG